MFLPADTTGLIEAVYGEQGPGAETPQALRAELEAARQEMARARSNAVLQADQRIVVPPDSANLLTQYNPALEEDNPELHQAFQAMTRLIGPSISLVCLFNTPQGLALDPDGQEIVDLETAPTAAQARRLLQNAVTLQHAGVVFALLNQEPPSTWRAHAALRHHRAAIFEGGRCRLEGTPYVLLLDRQIGLEVRKEEA